MGPRAGLDGCGKSRPHRDSIADRPGRSQSLHDYATRPIAVMCWEGNSSRLEWFVLKIQYVIDISEWLYVTAVT